MYTYILVHEFSPITSITQQAPKIINRTITAACTKVPQVHVGMTCHEWIKFLNLSPSRLLRPDSIRNPMRVSGQHDTALLILIPRTRHARRPWRSRRCLSLQQLCCPLIVFAQSLKVNCFPRLSVRRRRSLSLSLSLSLVSPTFIA